MIDYSKYPPNWKTEIRPAVLARANHCCEDCLVPNYALIYRPIKGQADWKLMPEGLEADAMGLDGIKFTKIILTIAHLDNDPENHDVKSERLKALCQRCHLRLDKNLHIQNRKYGRKHKENNIKIEFDGPPTP
jgi:hypothetical protein